MSEFKAKLCCDHDWHPLGNREICLVCDSICVREKGEIWYYAYPVDIDWEGKIPEYEQSW